MDPRDFFPRRKGLAGGVRQVAAPALNPKAGFGHGGMVFDKTRVGNAVGIRENQVVAASFGKRSIENNIFTKTTILVPNMSCWTRQRGKKSFQERSSFGSRTIVCDKNFPGWVSLVAESFETKLQRTEMVIGADHHGNLGRGYHVFLATRELLNLRFEDREMGLGVEGFTGGLANEITGQIAPAVDVNLLPEPLQQRLVVTLLK